MGPGRLDPSTGRVATEQQPFRILMVCTANICRSPLAEHLLRRALESRGERLHAPEFVVRSAGTHGWDGSEMDAAAAEQLRRLGGDPTGFLARTLDPGDCEEADLVLTATLPHRAAVLQQVPQALKRTFTLLEFAHLVAHVDEVRQAAGDPHGLVTRAATARGAAQLETYDVVDPYGAAPDVHRETADLVREAVRTIAAALTERTAY